MIKNPFEHCLLCCQCYFSIIKILIKTFSNLIVCFVIFFYIVFINFYFNYSFIYFNKTSYKKKEREICYCNFALIFSIRFYLNLNFSNFKFLF